MSTLKEFDLDLPYVENRERIEKIMLEKSIDYDAALKFDYNTKWKAKRSIFRLETRCITALYERLFEKFETNGCWKVLVECVDCVRKNRYRDLLGVYTIEIPVNIDRYFCLSDIEKKKMILELLNQGIDKIAKDVGWEKEPFDKAYKGVINSNYINEWIWKNQLKSPLKNFSAEVFCQHNLYSFDIYILVKSKNGKEIRREKVVSDKPDEFYFTEHLGQLKWTSNDEVMLINKHKDKQWCVKID